MFLITIILAIVLVLVLKDYSAVKKEYKKIADPQAKVKELEIQIIEKKRHSETLEYENKKLKESIRSQNTKLGELNTLYEALVYAVENEQKLPKQYEVKYNEWAPTVKLNFCAMDHKSLHKEFSANSKLIDKLAEETAVQFENKYTNKALSSIYKTATAAMRAELQNILQTVKYEKLDDALLSVTKMTEKYYLIILEGSNSLATALNNIISKSHSGKTVSEALRIYLLKLEKLFIRAVEIEYNYYVKKEQAKAEQAAIREQMRIEAAEKKALEEERKKVEKEESKYQSEISKLENSMTAADSEEKAKLEARIAELQKQLASVVEKKEEIIHLQNGKAGTVYVISNLGAFGEDVFKIGMTRRQNPQERIDELGDASVPFRFDVHSFIFSEDAVALENKLHTILNDKRLNKVNLRKEFFRINMNDLEKLVSDIDPTASFSTTMAAEEFRQSVSTDEVYTSDIITENEE